MQNLYGENELYLRENKNNHFQINGFSLSLGLKQRLKTAGKWPIVHLRADAFSKANVPGYECLFPPVHLLLAHTLQYP